MWCLEQLIDCKHLFSYLKLFNKKLLNKQITDKDKIFILNSLIIGIFTLSFSLHQIIHWRWNFRIIFYSFLFGFIFLKITVSDEFAVFIIVSIFLCINIRFSCILSNVLLRYMSKPTREYFAPNKSARER